jgi:hypothetical protein
MKINEKVEKIEEYLEVSNNDEYLQGVEILINMWYSRSMYTEEFEVPLEKEINYHYENLTDNCEIVEKTKIPTKPVTWKELEWIDG